MADTARPVQAAPQRKRPRRPAWILVAVFGILLRVGREVLDRTAASRFGPLGVLLVLAVVFVGILVWRYAQHRATRKRGGEELTPEMIRGLLSDSALPGPAWQEDGTLYGASLFAVCQRTMVLELHTAYDVFGSDGKVIARVRQIGQSKAKVLGRLFTSLDQWFTHHFDVVDPDGRTVLRLTRPRKLFLTKLHVYDGEDRFLGTIRQENVFGRIRFELLDPAGLRVGGMKAEKLQAWDFQIVDAAGAPVATIVKGWEGWARTILTRADRYAVRIHHPVEGALRPLAVAAALAVDLGLKQDARGFG